MIADRVPYQGTQHVAPIGAADPASWTFANVPNGTYVVAVTYSKDISGQASDALYQVYNGSGASTLAASWAVTQKADPSFYTQYGSEWLPIAVVSVTDRRLRVTLSAGTDGEAAADAVRIDPVSAVTDRGQRGRGLLDFRHGEPSLPDARAGRAGRLRLDRVEQQQQFGQLDGQRAEGQPAVPGVGQLGAVEREFAGGSVSDLRRRSTTRVGHGDGQPGAGSQQLQRGPFELAEPGRVHAHERFAAGDGGFALGQQLAGDRGRDPGERIGAARIVGPSFGVLNFGTTRLGENVVRSATLTNRGPGPLQLGTPVLVDGLANNFDYSGLFSLLGVGAMTLPPGASTTVDVRLNALWNGAYQGGTVTIPTNDVAAGSAVIKLQGAVGAAAAPVGDDHRQRRPGVQPGQRELRVLDGTRLRERRSVQHVVHGRHAGDGRVVVRRSGSGHVPGGGDVVRRTATGRATRRTSINGGTDIVVNQQAAPASFTADGASLAGAGHGDDQHGPAVDGQLVGQAERHDLGQRVRDRGRDPRGAGGPGADHRRRGRGLQRSGNIVPWTGQGYGNDVQFNQSFSDASQETFQWTFSNLSAGQYQVSATWTAHSNRASNAPYQINGGTDIVVNQQAAPGSFTSGGTAWAILGTATVGSGGTLTVTLSDDAGANGYVIADAIQVTPLAGSPVRVLDEVDEFLILNNGDVGTTCTNCSSWNFGQNLAYKREVFQLEGPATTEATWSADVEPGVYQVAISYSPYYTRGTNAHYEVSTATQLRDVHGESAVAGVVQRVGPGRGVDREHGLPGVDGDVHGPVWGRVAHGDAAEHCEREGGGGRGVHQARGTAGAQCIPGGRVIGQWSFVSGQWSVVCPVSPSPRLRSAPDGVAALGDGGRGDGAVAGLGAADRAAVGGVGDGRNHDRGSVRRPVGPGLAGSQPHLDRPRRRGPRLAVVPASLHPSSLNLHPLTS